MMPPLGNRHPETRHLNLKWTVADTDFVVGLARARRTASEIVERVKARGIEATPEEIRSICYWSNQKVVEEREARA